MTAPTTTARLATIDAAGQATVTFDGPASWSELHVDAIAVTCGGALMPTCSLYRGRRPASGVLLAATVNGSTGTFDRSGESDVIRAGETWCVQWTAASPGAACSAVLSGVSRRVGERPT